MLSAFPLDIPWDVSIPRLPFMIRYSDGGDRCACWFRYDVAGELRKRKAQGRVCRSSNTRWMLRVMLATSGLECLSPLFPDHTLVDFA
jgi:hypothetical protein